MWNFFTRMKKVAPPPPAPGGASSDQRPPLTNGDLRRQSSHEAPPLIHHHHNNQNHHPAMSTTPGEDCAFDELLEGRMELEVVLPDNRTVRMTVDRRTPMMDLLVHAATANKISPGGHVIRVVPKVSREHQQQLEEEDHYHPRDVPYKPNTPVGSLDVTTVHIVPKPHPDIPIKRMPKLANQPFEQTFRLQVNLPRNQRMVLRVSPRITLSELKRQICNEKELDHSSHHLVHPAQPDTVLDLNSSLEIYGCAEISLMSNSGLRDSIRSTSTHLIGYPRVEDGKKKKGILRLFSKMRKETTVETNTNGLGSRGVSPTRNLTISNRDSYQPKQSTKRKPAPAPPPPIIQQQQQPPPSPPLVIQSSSSINSRPESEISAKTDELGSTVSHSRHSSDSSGYHEPSVFSDCSQENKSPEASIVQGGGGGGITTTNVLLCTPPKDIVPPDSLPLVSRQTTPVKDQPQTLCLTNLKTVPCCSNTSIVSATRKRKAPQPPAPPVLQEVETPSSPEDLSPLDTCKPIPDSQTETQEILEESETTSSKAVEQVEDEPVETVASLAQTPEITRQQKEAITYLDDVLRESETTTKSPTRLSPTLDKHCGIDVVTEHSSLAADIVEDKLVDEHIEADEQDSQVIETIEAPSASVISIESPPTDDLSSHPEVDVINADVIEIASEHTIASERAPADGNDSKNEEDSISLETDTSEPPSVPLNKDILPQTVINSTVDTSMQPDSQENNFVSDFKDKPKEEEEERENQKSSLEISKASNSTEPLPSQEQLRIEKQPIAKSEVPSSLDNTKKNKITDLEMADQDCPVASVVTPRTQRKLVNFALGCYKSENKDIYNDQPNTSSEESQDSVSKADEKFTKTNSTAYRCKRPEVKIVPFEERSKTDSNLLVHKGQVQQRRTELFEIGTLPLTGRSSSLYNLTPQKKTLKDKPKPMEPLPEGLKRTQSDQNLAQETEEQLDFIQEQRRLHDEYLKLQAQFISWQKQLLNNQSLLQKEKMMPQMAFPALEQYKLQLENLPEVLQLHNSSIQSEDEELKTRSLPRQKSPSLSVKKFELPETPVVCQTSKPDKQSGATQPCSTVTEQGKVACLAGNPEPENTVIYAQVNKKKKTNKADSATINRKETSSDSLSESPELPEKQPVVDDNSKSQTLPRPKTQPISAFDASRTMTLNRQSRPKSQVVSVTIGSWQQRNQATPDIDSASVASSRSMFQSLENIPREHSKPTASVDGKNVKYDSSSSDKKEKPTPPDVITATVIVKKDGKEVVKDYKSAHGSSSNSFTQQKLPEVPKTTEVRKQNSKSEINPAESHTLHSKPSKPLVLLSSMKDETRPPSIQVLKKWPLSEMNEKDSAQKSGERSIWNELKASAKRPSGANKERVTRAEVDLRKHRTQKESSSKSPKNKDLEPSTSKLHISKVNINGETKTDKSSGTNSRSTSGDCDKQKKPFPKSKSETFNAELKDVLFKRASSLAEREDSDSKLIESNYAELNGGSGNNAPTKTVTVNGNSPPPPPPPPVSTMPTIPPAAPIPKSSQLLMEKRSKGSHTKVKSGTLPSKPIPSADPREELMLEIRGFGGKQALRKLQTKTGWNLKVYGSATLKS